MSKTSNIVNTVKGIFSNFISEQVPKKISNVLWQFFNGMQAVFQHLEWKIDVLIREGNILTASSKSSLRSLAAENGFEPSMKVPSQGLLKIDIKQSLYNKYGYPLYIPPYAEFTCDDNGMTYYYNCDKAQKLTSNTYTIPVVEGEIETKTFTGSGESIQRCYLTSNSVSEGSITVTVGDVMYKEVKSFYDNYNLNDNKLFLTKFSHDPQHPIALYIKGVDNNDTIYVTYRTTYGSLGNISGTSTFKTNDIINGSGEEINVDDDVIMTNYFGFSLGSDGTDINALKSAIGFNHGSELLFDNISLKNFINKFSTLVLQKITTDETKKSLNYIYVMKKQLITSTLHSIVDDYKKCINNKSYVLSKSEKKELSDMISEYEYCLTSHELKDPEINKFAFQIKYDSLDDKKTHSSNIEDLIYGEFSKFLYDRNYSFSFEQLMINYQKENDINLDWYIFSTGNIDEHNSTISSSDSLPIIKGDFEINTGEETITLFYDINHVLNV